MDPKELKDLRREIFDIRTQLKSLKGEGGASHMVGDIKLHGRRCRGASPSEYQDDYVTRGELEEAFSSQLKFKTFNAAGTTFDLDYVAESATSILVFANAGLLQYGDSGKTGYSVSLTGGTGGVTRITTVRTMLATDNILVVYVKKAL